MNKTNYLEMLPLNSIAKYPKSQPKNAVPFIGYPRTLKGAGMYNSLSAENAEKDKIILVYDPLGSEPVVLEFMLEDILYVEEVPSAVTEAGEGIPMIKLWVRHGAAGMILEPFEVNVNKRFDQVKAAGKFQAIKERIYKSGERGNRPQNSV